MAAEPQANTSQSTESRHRGETSSGAGETRSFVESQRRAGEAAARAAQSAGDGGRQLVEQGRRAGQQVAEAWRGAVDPFMALQYDMTRWFDDLWRQTFGFRPPTASHPLRPFASFAPGGLFGLPPADLRESDGGLRLAIELPGLTRDDIDVSIHGDALVVCGCKTEESDDANATYRVSERRFGRFERVFPLPPDVDRGKIEAQFRDGVLKIELPKDPDATPRRNRIEIRA
jgi:HSP20 family protein